MCIKSIRSDGCVCRTYIHKLLCMYTITLYSSRDITLDGGSVKGRVGGEVEEL